MTKRAIGWWTWLLLAVAGCGDDETVCPPGSVPEGGRCVAARLDGGGEGGLDGGPDGGDGCAPRTWFRDEDGDGFGDPTTATTACTSPGDGYVEDGTDCDDACAECYPGNAEACDGLDNDCSGMADDADDALLCPDDDNPCTVERCVEGACGQPEHGWHACGPRRACGHPLSASPATCLPLPAWRIGWQPDAGASDGGFVDVDRSGRFLVYEDRGSRRHLVLLRLDPTTGSLVEQSRFDGPRTGNYASWGDGDSVALDRAGGDAVLVGAQNFDAASVRAVGWAAVYERQADGTWEQRRLLHPGSRAADRRMGRAVALRGAWAAVATDEADRSGAVILFERDGDGTWRARQRLRSPAPAPGAEFGSEVFWLAEDRLLASEPEADGGRGAVHVFARGADGRWSLEATLRAPVPQANARFGRDLFSLRLSLEDGAPRFLVDEQNRRVGTTRRWTVYVAERAADGTWTVTELVPSGLGPRTWTGPAFLRGEVAVQTSGGDGSMGPPVARRLHVFRRVGAGNWREETVAGFGEGAAGAFPFLGSAGELFLGVGYAGFWSGGPTESWLFELPPGRPEDLAFVGTMPSSGGYVPFVVVGMEQGWAVAIGLEFDSGRSGLLTARIGD